MSETLKKHAKLQEARRQVEHAEAKLYWAMQALITDEEHQQHSPDICYAEAMEQNLEIEKKVYIRDVTEILELHHSSEKEYSYPAAVYAVTLWEKENNDEIMEELEDRVKERFDQLNATQRNFESAQPPMAS